MNKLIPVVSLACGLAVGQIALAEQSNDLNYGHAWLQDGRSPAHHVRSQVNSRERKIVGGYINVRHDDDQHHRLKHRRNRHTHHRDAEHRRGDDRRHHRHSNGNNGHDRRVHRGRDHHYDEHHERHGYYRPGRRISRIIRVY